MIAASPEHNQTHVNRTNARAATSPKWEQHRQYQDERHHNQYQHCSADRNPSALSLTVEVDREHGKPDYVPDEERGPAAALEQRHLAEHLKAHADQEYAPGGGLEPEEPGVFVAGGGADSRGGGTEND